MEKNIRFYLFLWNSKEKKKKKIYKQVKKPEISKCMYGILKNRQLSFVSKWKKILFIWKNFGKKKIQSVQKRKKFPNACVIYCNFVLKVNLNDSSLTCICLSYRICSLYWDSTANKDHTTIVEHTHSASQITECSQLNFI